MSYFKEITLKKILILSSFYSFVISYILLCLRTRGRQNSSWCCHLLPLSEFMHGSEGGGDFWKIFHTPWQLPTTMLFAISKNKDSANADNYLKWLFSWNLKTVSLTNFPSINLNLSFDHYGFLEILSLN